MVPVLLCIYELFLLLFNLLHLLLMQIELDLRVILFYDHQSNENVSSKLSKSTIKLVLYLLGRALIVFIIDLFFIESFNSFCKFLKNVLFLQMTKI